MIDPAALLARSFAPVEQTYDARDTILYALGVGFGADPMDAGQRRFVYEDGLVALPTLVNVLGSPGFWAREADTGIDWQRLVHADQRIVLHRPVAPAGRVIGQTRVTAFHDKGAGTGALMMAERTVTDAASGEAVATVASVAMLRGDGGTGVREGEIEALPPVPARPHDEAVRLETRPEMALLYRLSGDLNPLHIDPAVAAAAGFPRPILHGLATMGVAAHAVLRTVLDYDVAGIRGMDVRFTRPVIPGAVITTEMWREPGGIAFRSLDGPHVVLDRGWIALG